MSNGLPPFATPLRTPHSSVDANEAWSPENLAANLAACATHGIALIEQPLPAGYDAILADILHSVPFCADESLHDRADLAALRGRYDAINIKLDKAGGLTEALALADEAAQLGFEIMIGCMVATSLADGAGLAACGARAICRPRWAAASRTRPARRSCL